jgi:hypothetical protein
LGQHQALETELGGVQVYSTALKCARNDELRKEWQEYLEQTTRHAEVVKGVCGGLGLDAGKETAGRAIVRLKGESLVAAMDKALAAGDPGAAELVACECVVAPRRRTTTRLRAGKQEFGQDFGGPRPRFTKTTPHTSAWLPRHPRRFRL